MLILRVIFLIFVIFIFLLILSCINLVSKLSFDLGTHGLWTHYASTQCIINTMLLNMSTVFLLQLLTLFVIVIALYASPTPLFTIDFKDGQYMKLDKQGA